MSDHEHHTDVTDAEEAAQWGEGSALVELDYLPPFTPLPGRVMTQITHAQARTIIDALPPEAARSDEDRVTATVLVYALKQPEAR